MKKRFRDPYGCTATITIKADGTAHVISKTARGRTIRNSTHKNERAARAAMQRDACGLFEEVTA